MRDDLFTHIHKALRKGLFDLSVATGATDWTEPAEVAALAEQWRPFVDLLRSHTGHEDRHILRILDPHVPGATEAVTSEHRDLDDLLDDLDARFAACCADPSAALGLELYRDLNRFIAAYLPHLHEEEATLMPLVWAECTDEEIAATRAAFMAELTPEESELSMRLMLPALDGATRRLLLDRMAATAPSA
jgi:hypothetical protein